MTNLPAVREETAAQVYQPQLTIEIIRKYICPDATAEEAFLFMQLCLSQELNPYLRDAYLVVFGQGQNRKVSMIVGKDAFTKRADQQPSFQGYRAGVIVQRGESILELEGNFYLKDDLLVGGWFEGFRADRKVPHKYTVRLSEYSQTFGQWTKMPGTMIRKVALVGGLREMFPAPFRGLYDASEMGVDDAALPEAHIVVKDVEQPAIEAPTAKATKDKTPEEKKRIELFIKAREAGWSDDDLHADVQARFDVQSTKDLTMAQMNEILVDISLGKGPQMPEFAAAGTAQKALFGENPPANIG